MRSRSAAESSGTQDFIGNPVPHNFFRESGATQLFSNSGDTNLCEVTNGWTKHDRSGWRDPKIRATLFELACAYVKVIERIERTRDPKELQELEEQRVVCHNRFADALRAAGIRYKDREHVTRIALRIAKEEL
jgi:hypothetical protein